MTIRMQRLRRGSPTSLALALVAALSCTGGSEIAESPPAVAAFPPPVNESKPMLAPDGPLHPVVLTMAPDVEGRPGEPRLAFTSADREVQALVTVDEVPEGSTLAVSWYRRNPGHEHLFTHQIPIRSRERARSQAVAPSGLPSGIYETVATLGEHQVRRPWIVKADAGAESPGAIMQGSAAAEDGDAWDSWDLEGELPDWDDDEGWRQRAPPSPPPPTECTFTSVSARAQGYGELRAYGSWTGPCATVTLGVAFSGPFVLASTDAASEKKIPMIFANHWLCSIPGASDFPGTPFRAYITDSGGASRSEDDTLSDIGAALTVGFDSRPPSGARVRAGETIEIDALALLGQPSLGVRVLYLEAGDELIEAVGNLSGQPEPVPCDPRRLLAVIQNKPYTVPHDPPATIEICARGVGFDGTESTDCGTFYTGEVWEGTLDITATTVPRSPGPCGASARLEGIVRLAVAADGTVRGTVDVSGPCVSNPHGEFTGTATEDAFHLPELIIYNNGEPIPKVSPTEARATKSNFQGVPGIGGAQWDTTWELECVTCSLPRE